jgi:hypothetical protein
LPPAPLKPPAEPDLAGDVSEEDRDKRRKITMDDKPEFCTDEMLEYLDELRESGVTNMFGARPYILREFPDLTEKEAGRVLVYWMHSFSARRLA